MNYAALRSIRNKNDRRHAINVLKKLRGQLNTEIPAKDADGNLLLATWNIRDFFKKKGRGYGNRLDQSLFCIAEIISHFDIVAVQEVNQIHGWSKVMHILGRDWDYICSDVTDTRLGGNGERLTFVFDKRKVSFQNIAGEIVLPNKMLISQAIVEPEGDKGKKLYAGKQFRRTPYLAFFQAGWFKFALCSVHLYYGAESGAKLNQRVEEIAAVAKYFGTKAQDELNDDRTMILLGDFNIVHPEHKTMQALENNGFVVPAALKHPSNVLRSKYYDQIAFKGEADAEDVLVTEQSGGVFNIFKKIMRNTVEDREAYRRYYENCSAAKKVEDTPAAWQKHYRTWRTYQLSDHNPMWCRIGVNASSAYLDRLASE